APGSVLVVLAEAQSLSDLLTRVSDLNVAGARASEIKASLAHDLDELQKQRQREEAARAEQVVQRNLLNSELAQLQALQSQQEASMAQLQVKIAQTQYELRQLNNQSAQLAQAVSDMLQQQQEAFITAVLQSVWTQVPLWVQANNVGQIPTSSVHSTQYRFILPAPQAQISQLFPPR